MQVEADLQGQIARWIEEHTHDRPHPPTPQKNPRDARARFAKTFTSNMGSWCLSLMGALKMGALQEDQL